MIEKLLHNYLNERLRLDSYGRSAFHEEAPQKTVLPFVTFSLTTREHDYPKAGPSLIYSVFDLDCYAKSPESANEYACAIKRYIREMPATLDGQRITLAKITNEFDGEERQSSSFIRTLALTFNVSEQSQ